MTTARPIEDKIDGRYEVIEVLGQGSFGQTLLARDIEKDLRVAIKTLHPERADDLKSFEMFEREATVLGNLRHAGVPAILESFHAPWQGSNTAFLVMEYVEGPTLEELIVKQHSFAPDDILTLFLDLAGIVEYLHGRAPPILHRDIKPSNVILRDKTPVLVDFGAVRNVFRAPDESGSTMVGTYGYMPYEQYMGQATPASDLYALGATMLHVVTGRPPSEFLSEQGRLDVPQHVPGGDRVRRVLERLLAPAPADRIQSARHLRKALVNVDVVDEPAAVPAVVTKTTPTAVKANAMLAELPPAPRAIDGPTRDIFERNLPTTWSLMGATKKPGTSPTAGGIVLFALASVVTVGVLPLVYWLITRQQRARIKPFFEGGEPALARIQTVEVGNSSSGQRVCRVSYEFEADGHIHRGADNVFHVLADRWREGDTIAVLYLADRDYDSVIVSTS